MLNMKKFTIFIFLLFVLSHFFSHGEKNHTAWDGSRSIPVHRIPLMDENNRQIIPTESYPLPYSTRFTCGSCHDYDRILSGLHFNEGPSRKHPGRPGEPWFRVDQKSGTVLPISSRKWPGTYSLEEAGLTPWSYTLLFARHMPGGGLAEPRDRDVSPESRWNVSGALEINCMGCHNASRIQSHSEWARQTERRNFRWAAAAASSLGEVGGMASRLPGTWDIYDGPNPDDTVYAIVPTTEYDRNRFDSKHRVFFDILREPADERCLACHSTAVVGMERFRVDGDIHTIAGIKCAQCHRNDLSHRMIRGYEEETTGTNDADDFTCRGCHMDKSRGRLSAPLPKHKGLPAVHFDRLSCTVCHSGPVPGKNPARVRTSRANRLGIYGIAQWYTESPFIVEPVYQKGSDGKIAPFRLVWPSFWAKIEGEKITPLQPDLILKFGEGILDIEERIAKLLSVLSTSLEIKGEPVLIASSKVFRRNIDGLLDVSPFPNKTNQEMAWLVKTEGDFIPLVPGFDTIADPIDVNIENLIMSTLEALNTIPEKPGEAGLVYKDKLFLIVRGYIEVTEHQGEPARSPQLCWIKENKTIPLISPFDLHTVLATVGSEVSLTEEQVKRMLETFREGPAGHLDELNNRERENASPGGTGFAYIASGRLFKLDGEGDLVSGKHRAAEPVTWPMAHDVRPARLSLGAGGCGDCHSASSSFFFAKVEGVGPLKTEQKAVRSMHRFMGKDKYYETLFGLSFTFRPVLKILLFISIFFIASIILIIFLLALGRFSGIIKKVPSAPAGKSAKNIENGTNKRKEVNE